MDRALNNVPNCTRQLLLQLDSLEILSGVFNLGGVPVGGSAEPPALMGGLCDRPLPFGFHWEAGRTKDY